MNKRKENNYISQSCVDLHMHSMYSDDGEFTVLELLEKAKMNGLKVIAITDHNSVKAHFNRPVIDDLTCLDGIELDVTCLKTNLHVLGYGIDIYDPIYQQIETDIHKQELVASKKRVELLEQHLHVTINQEQLTSMCPHQIYTGECICEVLMNNPENKNNEYLRPYFEGGARSDNPFVNFYWDYCSQGKVAYVEIHYISLKQAIQMLHKQNAIAVLAHPGINVKENEELLLEIINTGIDGIEVYSSYHNNHQQEWYKQFANDHQLLITAGSDFHGKTKPKVRMGNTGITSYDEEKLIATMKQI